MRKPENPEYAGERELAGLDDDAHVRGRGLISIRIEHDRIKYHEDQGGRKADEERLNRRWWRRGDQIDESWCGYCAS